MKLLGKLFRILSSKEKELRTIWRVEREGKEGYLVGTAHFFPYRFKKCLQRYISKARVVLFEGPLDEKNMKRVVEQGSEGGGAASLFEALDAPTINRVKNLMSHLFLESGSLPLIVPLGWKAADPFYEHFQNLRPWMAFFEIWTHFLKEKGWKYSVDLEAWEIATRLRKEIFPLEAIEEQIAALEGISLDRFVNFLKKINQWEEYTKTHAHLYLQGKIEAMMAATNEFPSRCSSIVERRDPIMFARMKGFFEKGEAIAFLGTPHVAGIQKRFMEEGYKTHQVIRGEK